MISPISLTEIERVGSGLNRPECVLATADGSIWASNIDGGVSRLHPDGSICHRLGSGAEKLFTNGFCFLPDGAVLVAHLQPPGGVWKVTTDGTQAPFLQDVAGETIPPANFVALGPDGHVWATVSTRHEPRSLAYRQDIKDGYVVRCRADGSNAEIVADGLGYTNELAFSPDGQWLYVNETFSRRTSRFAIQDGGLGPRETVLEYGPGTFPDGLVFDAEGAFWITSIISNRVIRVTAGEGAQVILEDSNPEHLTWVEDAFQAGRLDRPHLDTVKSTKLQNISSLCFAGADRKTMVMGCLLGDHVYRCPSPVAGARPVHWEFTL